MGRMEDHSEEPLLARPDRMPVLRHHSNLSFPHLGRTPARSRVHPSSQGTASPAIPVRFRAAIRPLSASVSVHGVPSIPGAALQSSSCPWAGPVLGAVRGAACVLLRNVSRCGKLALLLAVCSRFTLENRLL